MLSRILKGLLSEARAVRGCALGGRDSVGCFLLEWVFVWSKETISLRIDEVK